MALYRGSPEGILRIKDRRRPNWYNSSFPASLSHIYSWARSIPVLHLALCLRLDQAGNPLLDLLVG